MVRICYLKKVGVKRGVGYEPLGKALTPESPTQSFGLSAGTIFICAASLARTQLGGSGDFWLPKEGGLNK